MTEMSIKMTPVTQKRSQPVHVKENISYGKGSFLEALRGELGAQKDLGELSTNTAAPSHEKPTSEKNEQTETTLGLSTGMLDMLSQLVAQIPTQEAVVDAQNVPSQATAILVGEVQASNANATVQAPTQAVIPTIVSQESETLVQQVNLADSAAIAKSITEEGNKVMAQPQLNVDGGQAVVLPQTDVSTESKIQAEQVPINPEIVNAKTETMTRGDSKVSAPVVQAAPSETVSKPIQVTAETTTIKTDSTGSIGQAIAVAPKTDTNKNASDTKDNEENLANKFAPTDKLLVQKENETSYVKISDEANNLDKTTVEQVVNSVKANLDNGKKEFMIDLFPTNLGKISVKLISQGGTMLVELVAQNPKTQSMLMANSGEIKELVQATTSTITQVVAPSHEEAMQQNYTQQEKEQQKHPQQQQEASEDSNTAENPVNFMEVLQQLRQSKQIVKSYTVGN